MASSDILTDFTTNIITLPDSRWYDTPDGKFPSVTTKLGVYSKPGLETWKIKMAQLGADVKKLGQANMDEGSTVHKLSVKYDLGEEISLYDDNEKMNYDFWREWLPFLRYIESVNEYKMEHIMTESTVWSKKYNFAGTLDRLSFITLPKKKTPVLTITDLKRSSVVDITYGWQLAAYKAALVEMYYENKHECLTDFKARLKTALNGYELRDMLGHILLLNTESEKGYRMTMIEDMDVKFNAFLDCSALWDKTHPNYEMSRKMYPMKVKKGVANDEETK